MRFEVTVVTGDMVAGRSGPPFEFVGYGANDMVSNPHRFRLVREASSSR